MSNLKSLHDAILKDFIGFDMILDTGRYQNTGFPPHNIEKISDISYNLILAVAGYKRENLTVTVANNELIIEGNKEPDTSKVYTYKGIAERSFLKRLSISDFYEVTGVTLEDGLLTINLVKNVPEQLKPKVIEIK